MQSTTSFSKIDDPRTNMQKKPLNAKQVKSLSKLLADKPRDRALFHVGIDSMLRSSDLRNLTVEDVVDSKRQVREQCSITQQKTGRTVVFTLGEKTRAALQKWIEVSRKVEEDYLFTSRTKQYDGRHLFGQPIARCNINGW